MKPYSEEAANSYNINDNGDDLILRSDIMPAVVRALTSWEVVGEYDEVLAGEISNEVNAIPAYMGRHA